MGHVVEKILGHLKEFKVHMVSLLGVDIAFEIRKQVRVKTWNLTFSFLFFFRVEDQAQDLVIARQALYH